MTFLRIYAYSQKNDNTAENLSDKFLWGVSVAPALIEKGHIYGDKDKYRLSSSPKLGGEVLINYYYNFESNYSLVLSAGVEALVHNLYYEIPKEMFIPPVASNISFSLRMPITFVKSQVELQFKFLKNQKKSWFGSAGLSILYAIEGPDAYSAGILLGTSSQSVQEYLQIGEFNKSNPTKARLNFHVSVGHEWVIHSGSRLQTNLKFNYSPTNFSAEPYRFTVGNQSEVSGKYGITGSYVGLCVSYIFFRK
jgi:hypothetical protein